MTKGRSSRSKSGSAPFRAHARLLRLLGEELISDEVIAIVELVKNSYDADAQQVVVTLENITDPEHGLIRVADNGSGMTLDTVLHSWLEPASSQKRSRKGVKARTAFGRIPLGEKGIGRFAVDKLGSELELITRAQGDSEETVLHVRWHHYDQEKYLDEVENVWETRRPVEFPGNVCGTTLLISHLRAAWDQGMMTRLHEGLMRLISPFAADSGFAIEIQCPEFPEFNGSVVSKLLDTAPYRLSGSVDAEGLFTITIPGLKEVVLRPLNRERFICPDGTFRTPHCGPFTISLNIWDLEPNMDGTTGINNTLRKMIKARSGVSIYRDSFRVWPYGERDDDWLELNQRRVNNPTLRVSNNQVIGFVEITHTGNPDLRDRTSREGLLDNPAFFDLKALVVAALSVLETARFERRREFSPQRFETAGRRSDPILQFLSHARETNGKAASPVRNDTLMEVERLYREKARDDQVRYSQVARLAGAGMAAELMTDTFSREISNAMTVLRTLNGESRTGASAEIVDLIQELNEQMERINEQLDMMKPLYRPSVQESDPVTVRGVVYDVVSILTGRLAETGTRIKVVDNSDLLVRMNRGHLMQVLLILLENSLTAMQEARVIQPQIEMHILSEEKFNGLRVTDNGPGVPRDLQHLIFEPYYSTRAAGRGLGLNVARDILSIYTSNLELVDEGHILPGACFEIRFDGRRISRSAAV